jgi:hypothetical protein
VFPDFEGYRQIVDNKFIEAFLDDFARRQGLDKEAERKDETGMKLTTAWKHVGFGGISQGKSPLSGIAK